MSRLNFRRHNLLGYCAKQSLRKVMILKGPNFNKFLRCSEAVESFDEQCITLEFI